MKFKILAKKIRKGTHDGKDYSYQVLLICDDMGQYAEVNVYDEYDYKPGQYLRVEPVIRYSTLARKDVLTVKVVGVVQ